MTKFILNLLIVFSLLFTSSEADLIKSIQEKNGDVYILVRPENGGTPDSSTGLWHFRRTQNYSPSRLPLSNDSRIVAYEGLSVDKFGHVKLFRTNSRENTSLWTLLNEGKIHPDSPACDLPLGKDTYQAVKSYGAVGGGGCAANSQPANVATFDSVNFGWSYVINTVDGKEGWYCIYPSGTYAKAYSTPNNGSTPQMINCRFDYDDAKFASWEADADRHAKVVYGLAPNLAAGSEIFPPLRGTSDPRRHPTIPGIAPNKGQKWGKPVGFLAHGRGHFMLGHESVYNTFCGAGCTAGANNPDRIPSARRRGQAAPLLGWFWARDPLGFKPDRTNGRRIRDLKLSRSKLFMEEYITAEDNELLKNSTTTGFSFTAGEDYYLGSNCTDPSNYTGSGFLHCRSNPIDTAYAFGEEIENYNDCSDLCGQADPNPTTVNAVLNKGRAKFSSAGSNQNLQRAYIIKKYYPVSGSQDDTYGVFQIDGTSLNSYLDWKNDSLDYKSTGVLSETNGAGILRKFNPDDYVIAYNFGAAQGGDGKASSLQTSKRISPTGDDSKDFIYVSDLAPSHFNVSSSFWGTGGMVWWAQENGTSLRLNYEQYNHFRGVTPLTKGAIDIPNATPLVAFGADGDNFIYILHGGGGDSAETETDIDRLVSPKTYKRVQDLCDEGGRMVRGCNNPPAYSTAENGYVVTLEVNRFAGLKLEKLAPLKGSKPVRIGTVPLQSQGGATCVASLIWPGPSTMPPPTDTDPGSISAPGWVCSGSDDVPVQAIIDSNLIEMAIVNVANPPATGGELVMDIVEPDDRPADGVYEEDEIYRFNMENPPRFNGPIAQLSLSGNDDASVYGDVDMISNYDEAGIITLKEELGSTTATILPGTPTREFYDNDNIQGRMLPSFIYEDLKVPNSAPLLMNDSYGFSSAPQSGAVKTLRYRWRIKALTPPHSFKDYNRQACVGLLKSGNGLAMTNVTTLTEIGLLQPVTGNENLMNNEPGVLFDSCWQDFGTNNYSEMKDQLVDTLTKLTDLDAVNPPTLRYKFEDPGVYEIQLWVGGLRFFADDFTFLDNPSTISMVLDATNTKQTIKVGAAKVKGSDKIKKVVIANNDLESNQQTRAALYTNTNTLKNKLATENDDLIGLHGRFPVLPVGNYSKNKPLIVTYQNQETPIVAEAEIQFFRLSDLIHHNLNADTQKSYALQKFDGVGAWDYSYPGGGAIPFEANFTFTPVDKRSEHPANWSTRTVGTSAIIATDDTSLDERRGYDASGNYQTGRGYNAAGLIDNVTDPDKQFQAAHQGTLASDDAFPSPYMGRSFDKDLLSHPEAMYTWWEIKYAWFMRYTLPNGDVVKEVLKTGNLAEIFLLNHMAKESNSWKQLVQNLAPNNIHTDAFSPSDDGGPLMKWVGGKENRQKDRKVKVRIPLFKRNALLTGSKTDEMNQSFKDLSALDTTTSFSTLYDRIHPMKFNTPTEPTIIEIGLQIFHPEMNWEGRDKNDDDSFNYYDAVYWGTQSKADGTANPADFSKIGITFGSDTLSVWPMFATQKLSDPALALDSEANSLGLNLVATKSINGRQRVDGGFGSDGTDIVYYPPGGERDDFVEIVVLDMLPPKLNLIKGSPQNVNTGGSASEDIVIEVEDNNPYAVWSSYEDIGDLNSQLIVPALVDFSYEVGFDPRNEVGLGLKSRNSKPQRAYGLNLSYTNLSAVNTTGRMLNINDLPQYKLDAQTGVPIRQSNPGFTYTPNGGNIEAVNTDFYFPYKDIANSSLLAEDGIWFLNRAKPSQYSADQEAYKDSWNRFNTYEGTENYKLYPPKLHPTDSGVRTKEPDVYHPEIYKWMIRFVPDVDNQSPYNANGSIVEYLDANPGSGDDDDYQDWEDACLDGSINPTQADPANCKIRSRWKIAKENILAPVFFNSNDNTMKFYAKARDVRISEDWPSLDVDWGNQNSWPNYPFTNQWTRRVGAEDCGSDPTDRGPKPTGISDLVTYFYNNDCQRYSKELGEITISDNDIPNVHITIYEYKNQTQVEYAIMNAQGNDPSVKEDSEDVLIFRSKDKRSQIAEFNSDGLYEQATDLKVVNINTVKSGMDLTNQAYHIPEDVRFMIQVVASDNKDLDEISIKISSHFNSGAVFNPPAKYTHVSDDPSNKPFNSINSSNGRIYNQSKVLRGYHLYPNSGVYDVLSVEVSDASGNDRIVNIPIIVVPQDVHFRSLGTQNKGR